MLKTRSGLSGNKKQSCLFTICSLFAASTIYFFFFRRIENGESYLKKHRVVIPVHFMEYLPGIFTLKALTYCSFAT